MDSSCRKIQEILVEASGDVARLERVDQRHVDRCPDCARIAEGERLLAARLQAAVPPHDEELQRAIAAAIEGAAVRRRRLALLPVAAALLITAAGVLLLGGIPGSGLLGQLPATSAHGWSALTGLVGDWAVALLTTARAAGDTMPTSVQLAALTVALVAASGCWRLLSGARKVAAWRRAR